MRVQCVNEVPGVVIIVACKGGTVVASTLPQEADLGWESGLRRSHRDDKTEQMLDTWVQS